MQKLVKELLKKLGEDPEREGLKETPRRVAESLKYITKGYKENAKEILSKAIFPASSDHMVIVKNIEFYSLCEHHLLPFYGKCHIGYICKDRVYGLSKLARTVECFARRLQLQERLTQQVAEVLKETIGADGVGVVMEGKHLCMMMRGVEKQESVMITSAMLGQFRKDHRTREEFLRLIQSKD